MLSSNMPYHRVDDGIGAGLVSGAVVGGAVAGATHLWGNKAINGLQGLNSGAFSKSSNVSAGRGRYEFIDNALGNAEKYRGKAFGGGWKGKAAAYGGSVLAGALLGGLIDKEHK